jgi:hypothetical protein
MARQVYLSNSRKLKELIVRLRSAGPAGWRIESGGKEELERDDLSGRPNDYPFVRVVLPLFEQNYGRLSDDTDLEPTTGKFGVVGGHHLYVVSSEGRRVLG